MSNVIEIKVPDIGDFDGVEIIDVLVSVGDSVEVEQPLITLESDKASMDIPSTAAGVVQEMKVSLGEKVSEGSLVLLLSTEATASTAAPVAEVAPTATPAAAASVEVKVPDIGEFDGVEIIDVLVNVGDSIEVEQPLITLESDKASMDIPSPEAGVVQAMHVALGDKVSEGSLVLTLSAAGAAAPASASAPAAAPAKAEAETVAPVVAATIPDVPADIRADVVVLGAGPGGYTAAFRAADLGKKVVLVERYSSLGGVCLNVGCIPSKALLHTAAVINEAEEMTDTGVVFAKPEIDRAALLAYKEKIVNRLTGGLSGLAKQRKVEVVHGVAEFSSANTLTVATEDGEKTIAFANAIIAAGSQTTKIPGFPYEDERLIDSTGALALKDIPKRMLVIGGGIIGLEMATVYAALGTKITIAEFTNGLIPGADRDIVKPLEKRIKKKYENIFVSTKVTGIEAKEDGLHASFEGKNAPEKDVFDKVLVSVGRRPNGGLIGADKAGVQVDDYGFIAVDKQMRTNVPHIFAIGDIVGQPMLAHKAVHEGKVAAEVIAGHKSFFDARTIPSVAYTDPEVAWMGLTETEAKTQKIAYEKGSFPWAASGRSLSIGRDEGITKVLFDKETKRIIGAGIVGTNAGELIAEAVLALEMGADVEDIALTIHPHPTLSETFNFAAEMAEGTITDLYAPRRKPW